MQVSESGTMQPNRKAEARTSAEPIHAPFTLVPVEAGDGFGATIFPQGARLYGMLALLAVVVIAALALIIRGFRAEKKRAPTQYTEMDAQQSEEGEAPAMSESGWHVSAAQTIGTRKRQEDALCYSNYRDKAAVEEKGLFVAMADGIGGIDGGQQASINVVRRLLADFMRASPGQEIPQALMRLVANAQHALKEANRQRASRSGCTLVCFWIWEDAMHFASVGDSRAYLYRGGGLIQLNREHVLGAQMDEGLQAATPDDPQRRKALTAYMGKGDLQMVDRNIHPIPFCPGDRLLLMSDGVFGTLSEAQIIQGLEAGPQNPADAIVRMVDAQQKTHQDNATVVVVWR